uniref:Uncharacterized protein n=1 Tax=viral metagenome TaxID=1070528 RepID=A0A6C0K5F5_9ZZZZ
MDSTGGTFGADFLQNISLILRYIHENIRTEHMTNL